jgi:hypothetical protein
MAIYENPEIYVDGIPSDEFIERNYRYEMPEHIRALFSKSAEIDMNIFDVHRRVMAEGHRPKMVIDHSMQQHVQMCIENSGNLEEALALADQLKEEIEYRIRCYGRCLAKTSESYVKWLQDEYKRTLKVKLIHHSHTGPEVKE